MKLADSVVTAGAQCTSDTPRLVVMIHCSRAADGICTYGTLVVLFLKQSKKLVVRDLDSLLAPTGLSRLMGLANPYSLILLSCPMSELFWVLQSILFLLLVCTLHALALSRS